LLRLLPETAGPVGKQDCDPLSPATWRGFFCVPRALCNQPWYCLDGFAVVAAASPLCGTLPRFGGAFFVRRVSGRNENPSRVVLQPDVGHGLFQGRREPNARNVTRISPLRCATDCVVLSRWVCRYSHRQALDETRLSPAAAGLFRAGPPRSAQPTERLGVGVVGLRFGEIGKPVMATNMTHLAPSPWRGFCLAAARRMPRRDPAGGATRHRVSLGDTGSVSVRLWARPLQAEFI
jgi:hypothetical protein